MTRLAAYRREWFSNIRGDILSGIVVALALIPEAIGFSVIAGVDPKVGLFASFAIACVSAFTGGRPGMISAATAATGSPWNFVSPVAMTGRSVNCGPKRGIGSGRSKALNTATTPGTFWASLESIVPMRPRAQGSVTSLTCSSLGR